MLAVLKLGGWFEIEIHHVYKFFRVGQLAISFSRNGKPWNYFDAYKEPDDVSGNRPYYGAYYVHAFTWEVFFSTNG